MITDLMTLYDFLKRLYRLREAHRWDRAARRALRHGELIAADRALERARELSEQ